MIAARLAGGNLFFAFFGWGGDLGGGFWVGDFVEHSEHSEQLGALGFFLRGFFLVGILFLGVVGCVLDCKCWKKLKND